MPLNITFPLWLSPLGNVFFKSWGLPEVKPSLRYQPRVFSGIMEQDGTLLVGTDLVTNRCFISASPSVQKIIPTWELLTTASAELGQSFEADLLHFSLLVCAPRFITQKMAILYSPESKEKWWVTCTVAAKALHFLKLFSVWDTDRLKYKTAVGSRH